MCRNSARANSMDEHSRHPRRILKVAGGKATQCLHCKTIGLEIGTCYLVFEEAQFGRFVSWFVRASTEGKLQPEDGRIRISLGDPNLMMSLSENEIRSLTVLLEQTRVWASQTQASSAHLSSSESPSAWSNGRLLIN